jgi:membrane associated rhomboid family serine protease
MLNMLALRMPGRDVERTLGSQHYAVMCFAAVLSAAVQLLVVSSTLGPDLYPTIGARAACSASARGRRHSASHRSAAHSADPDAGVVLRAYGLIELVSGVVGTKSGIAHFAPRRHVAPIGRWAGALAFGPWRRICPS